MIRPSACLAAELARAAGIRLLAFFRPSRQALALLKQGLVHVAGSHLSHAGDEGNAAAVEAELGSGYRLVRVAEWEEGVATASGDRSSLRALVKSKPRWVGREPGSGARQCLDELLGSRPRRAAPPATTAASPKPSAAAGPTPASACALAAEEANLKFLSVRKEAYDLCFADAMDDDPRIRAC